MTPDKVEAALGVLRGGRRSPHCDESRPAGIVFVGEEVSAYDHALSVLTEALAERGWRPIEEAPRDGTWVFGMHVAGNYKGRPFAMHSYDGQWVDGQWAVLNPTHFLPIPAMKETP